MSAGAGTDPTEHAIRVFTSIDASQVRTASQHLVRELIRHFEAGPNDLSRESESANFFTPLQMARAVYPLSFEQGLRWAERLRLADAA